MNDPYKSDLREIGEWLLLVIIAGGLFGFAVGIILGALSD